MLTPWCGKTLYSVGSRPLSSNIPYNYANHLLTSLSTGSTCLTNNFFWLQEDLLKFEPSSFITSATTSRTSSACLLKFESSSFISSATEVNVLLYVLGFLKIN